MQVSFFSVQPHTEPFAFRILEFRFRFLDSLGFGKNKLGISHEPHFLQCRVQDVGWVYHQLCRTIMCFIARGGACEKQLLSLLKKLFVGSSTTKNICEATFAHLYHMVNKQSKNWKMNDWTKYLYAILSPYVETSGMCQLLPDNDDWTTVRSNLGVDLRKTAHKFFNVNSTPMPDSQTTKLPRSEKQLDTCWRKVGTLADERSVSAMAYLVSDYTEDFEHIQMSWAGIGWENWLLLLASICCHL